MKRDDEFVWMKIMGGVKLSGDLIIEEYSGAEYLLVHNWPSSAMSSGINWGLESVRRQPSDNMGRPCVGFLLDHDGGDYFYSLTSSNIGEAVAIVVEGKVASTPSIASAVRRQGIITGDFSEEQIAEMVKVLRKEVRPVSSTPKPSILSSVRPYLIPTVIILLAVMVLGFLIYR